MNQCTAVLDGAEQHLSSRAARKAHYRNLISTSNLTYDEVVKVFGCKRKTARNFNSDRNKAPSRAQMVALVLYMFLRDQRT